MTPEELLSNVDTIVILMMENRSFDHVLGHLGSASDDGPAGVDGIKDVTNVQYGNPNLDGVVEAPSWVDDGPLLSDLPHDSGAVKTQLAFSPVTNKYAMNGFVRAFETEFHTSISNPPVMGLLKRGGAPVTTALARQYVVCDQWFSCIPTSTAPNRLMSMCGYSDIAETGGMLPDQDTVYDWLSWHKVSWRVSSRGLPFFMLMPRMVPHVLSSYFRKFRELKNDLSAHPWPQVIFIEPDYYDSPFHIDPCDNHAPLAMAPGESFLADVYKTFTKFKEQWARTVFILTYDEHGGFFDHVPPRPIKYRNPNGVSFDSTGPRTPSIVAGPFAPPKVAHNVFDNTSILQLLAERFGLPGEAYSSTVDARKTQGIQSVSSVLEVSAKNAEIAELPAVTATPGTTRQMVNPLRHAFHSAADMLLEGHTLEAQAKYPELKKKP